MYNTHLLAWHADTTPNLKNKDDSDMTRILTSQWKETGATKSPTLFQLSWRTPSVPNRQKWHFLFTTYGWVVGMRYIDAQLGVDVALLFDDKVRAPSRVCCVCCAPNGFKFGQPEASAPQTCCCHNSSRQWLWWLRVTRRTFEQAWGQSQACMQQCVLQFEPSMPRLEQMHGVAWQLLDDAASRMTLAY